MHLPKLPLEVYPVILQKTCHGTSQKCLHDFFQKPHLRLSRKFFNGFLQKFLWKFWKIRKSEFLKKALQIRFHKFFQGINKNISNVPSEITPGISSKNLILIFSNCSKNYLTTSSSDSIKIFFRNLSEDSFRKSYRCSFRKSSKDSFGNCSSDFFINSSGNTYKNFFTQNAQRSSRKNVSRIFFRNLSIMHDLFLYLKRQFRNPRILLDILLYIFSDIFLRFPPIMALLFEEKNSSRQNLQKTFLL